MIEKSMNNNVEVIFKYESKNGSCVQGRMTFPFFNGVAFKPYNVSILSGILDMKHLINEGVKATKQRERKNKILSDNFEVKGGFAYIKKPFFINDGAPIGLVSLVGLLNGYNSNRSANIRIINKKLNNYKLAKLMQNLKLIKNDEYKLFEYISLDYALTKYHDYFNLLVANYYKNKKTTSSIEMEDK